MAPTVTIIIPTYNSSATIAETLESVNEQTYRDYEVIVVDDCSSDDTVDVLKKIEVPHSLIVREENGGPAAARNDGIAVASGEWIAFLDGDDVWLPRRLEVQMEAAKIDSDVSAFCGRIVDFGASIPSVMGPDSSAEALAKADLRDLSLEEFVYRNPVSTSTVLARKDAIDELGGFDESFVGPEDYDLWMRLVSRHRMQKLGLVLARYREYAGSLSMDDRKFLPQVRRVLDKAYGENGALRAYGDLRRSSISTQLWNASWMAFVRGARTVALGLLIRSYAMNIVAKQQTNRRWFHQLGQYLFSRGSMDTE